MYTAYNYVMLEINVVLLLLLLLLLLAYADDIALTVASKKHDFRCVGRAVPLVSDTVSRWF